MDNFIPVNEPLVGETEKELLIQCIDTGWVGSDGPFVKQFEKEFSLKIGRKFGIAVTNGSAALDVAVTALDIQKGDEVIMPTFTIISTINQVIRTGARPVLVDANSSTWNMDVSQLKRKITSNTKAIMVVHLYGLPVDVAPVLELANEFKLRVIEDASQMIGQTYRERPCGTFGDISTFSFYPNKHVTTGEGGMIVTDDPVLANRCRSLRNLCFQSNKRFVHEELGWNMRMSNLQAAVGLAQLTRLDYFIEKKRHMGRTYNSLLEDIKELQLPVPNTEYAENIYWAYAIVLNNRVKLDAIETIRLLARMGIGARPFFWCMHEQPVFRKIGMFKGERYPNAENMARRGLYLPSGLNLSDKQITRVASAVKRVVFKNIK